MAWRPSAANSGAAPPLSSQLHLWPPPCPAAAACGARRPADDVQLQRGHEPERAVCAHAAGAPVLGCPARPCAVPQPAPGPPAPPRILSMIHDFTLQLHIVLALLPSMPPCFAAGGGAGCWAAHHGAARGRRRARPHAGPHLPRGPVPHQRAAAGAVSAGVCAHTGWHAGDHVSFTSECQKCPSRLLEWSHLQQPVYSSIKISPVQLTR